MCDRVYVFLSVFPFISKSLPKADRYIITAYSPGNNTHMVQLYGWEKVLANTSIFKDW